MANHGVSQKVSHGIMMETISSITLYKISGLLMNNFLVLQIISPWKIWT